MSFTDLLYAIADEIPGVSEFIHRDDTRNYRALAAAARRVNYAASRYGLNSPQHRAARAAHAQLCRQFRF